MSVVNTLSSSPDESVGSPSPILRSAEKSRKPTCAFADEVASISINLFNTIKNNPGVNIDYKQSVLSTVCVRTDLRELNKDTDGQTLRDDRDGAEDGVSLEVVSLGCGTKYLACDTIQRLRRDNLLSRCVQDMHGEILAMRAFRVYLAAEAATALKFAINEKLEAANSPMQSPSRIFKFNQTTNDLEIRPGVTFHMYTSSQPCGNASVKKWASGGIGPTFPNAPSVFIPYPLGSPQALPHVSSEAGRDEKKLIHQPISFAPAQFGSVAVLYKRPRNSSQCDVAKFGTETQEIDEQREKEEKVRVVETNNVSLGTLCRMPLFDSSELPPSCVPIPGAHSFLASGSADTDSRSKETWIPESAVLLEDDKILSCSDKIMQRNVLGFQGKNLSPVVGRVHISSLVVGRKFTLKTAERAVCCRVADVKGVVIRKENQEIPKGGSHSNGETKSRTKNKGKFACEVPLPFGVKHMACMSSGVKLDQGVYECPKVVDNTLPTSLSGASSITAGKGADFSDCRCICWAKIRPNNNNELSFLEISGGQAEVLDGNMGIRYREPAGLTEADQKVDNLESFISSNMIKKRAGEVIDLYNSLSVKNKPHTNTLDCGSGAVSCIWCDQLDDKQCHYHVAKSTLRTRSLPFHWS